MWHQGNRQVRAPYGEINGSHSTWYSFLIHSYLWQVVKDEDGKKENRDTGMRHKYCSKFFFMVWFKADDLVDFCYYLWDLWSIIKPAIQIEKWNTLWYGNEKSCSIKMKLKQWRTSTYTFFKLPFLILIFHNWVKIPLTSHSLDFFSSCISQNSDLLSRIKNILR